MAGKRHTPATRRAAEILLRETVHPSSWIADELGIPHRTMRAWSQRRGSRPAGLPSLGTTEVLASPATGEPPDRAALEAVLRHQIARQIALLGAQLDAPTPGLDSARMLRDLGGLKRLIDELSEPVAERNADVIEPNGEAGEDELFAMRAEIARRYAGFAGRAGRA